MNDIFLKKLSNATKTVLACANLSLIIGSTVTRILKKQEGVKYLEVL